MMGHPWERPAMGSTSKDTMPRSSSIGSLQILFIECCVFFEKCGFCVDTRCVFHNPTYVVLCLMDK